MLLEGKIIFDSEGKEIKVMGKKLKTIIIGILIIWVIIFVFDFGCCNSLHSPIFVIPSKNVDEGGSGTYYGLGYTVELEKYKDTDYGMNNNVLSVEMYILGKVITASTQ